MDSNNEVPTKAASPTSDNQMGNPNSTNIAGFHQSNTFFPGMPLPSSEGGSNHYKNCMHALSMPWQNHNSGFTLRELWTATMKYQQRQPALPQITRWAIQTAQTSQDFINRTHFSLECHCPHQKADQTTLKPVCMRCPCLGKTTTLHLRYRYVSYGRQQWSTNKGVPSPTSDYQMGNPNSTNIAGFHQSDTLFPGMPLPSSEGRSNHYKTCMHALSMSWQNHNSALDYGTWAMDSNNEVPTIAARPTSDNQMSSLNSA